MTRKELEELIRQIEMQVEHCRKLLKEGSLTNEERENVGGQILRQEEELKRLRKELESLPEKQEEMLMAEEDFGIIKVFANSEPS